MEWIDKKMEEIANALKEIENANLTTETKIVTLKVLKEELTALRTQKTHIVSEMEFTTNGFKK